MQPLGFLRPSIDKAAAFSATGVVTGPGQTITMADFPFGTTSAPYAYAADVAGSNGVVATIFNGIDPGSAVDLGTFDRTTIFGTEREVTGRNAPTYINAVFNVKQFWDGRANQVFNGNDPFGGTGSVLVDDGAGLQVLSVAIQPASLASQGVGPPNNQVEMSWKGRSFPELGRKMLSLKPLALQTVSPTDSVLGSLADPAGGLKTTYSDMIKAAFQPRFWQSNQMAGGFTQYAEAVRTTKSLPR